MQIYAQGVTIIYNWPQLRIQKYSWIVIKTMQKLTKPDLKQGKELGVCDIVLSTIVTVFWISMRVPSGHLIKEMVALTDQKEIISDLFHT